MAVLSIDQGTTSTKAFLLHEDGRFEPVGQIAHQQFHPGPGLVEHDASELIAAIETLIDQAIATGARIDGLALANQGETVIAWDRESDAPLHRAIVWQDQRTQALLDTFDDTERTIVQERAGLPLDAYFSASKIAWLLEQPEVAAAREAGRLGIGTLTVSSSIGSPVPTPPMRRPPRAHPCSIWRAPNGMMCCAVFSVCRADCCRRSGRPMAVSG